MRNKSLIEYLNLSALGTKASNVFPLKWSRGLCEMDSDGDGMTNGEEVGDPQCVWTPGNNPNRTTNITHPGNQLELIWSN